MTRVDPSAPRRRRPLLFLLAALLGLVTLLAWSLLAPGPGDAEPARGNSATVGDRSAGSPPAGTSADDLAQVALGAGAREAIPQLRLEDAVWIEGTLELPPGTPADERLSLHAASSSPGQGWRERECELRSDGSFRAPVAAGATHALLRLEARYLFLREPASVDLAAGAARLRPELGGWLVGRLDAPPGRGIAAGCEARVHAWGRGGLRPWSAARVGTEGTFELRGLPADVDLLLVADPGELAALTEPHLRLRAGERLERAWTLAAGASVEGRVLDADGRALAGAQVQARTLGLPEGAGLERRAETGPEGGFTLSAIAPGVVSITAELSGYEPGALDPIELSDGQRLGDRDLRLGRGNALTGLVQWPDGSAAVGARIHVLERVRPGARTGWRDLLEQQLEADDEGRFRAQGLGAGPLALRAACARGGAGAAVWHAAEEGLQPGADVALTLAPPATVAGKVVDDLGRPLERFTVSIAELGAVEARRDAVRELPFVSPDGSFQVGDLWAGRWRLTARAGGHAPAELELNLPADLAPCLLALPRAARVSGTVVAPGGAPVPGARVELLSVDGQRAVGGEPARTGADGSFALAELAPRPTSLAAAHADFARSLPASLQLEPGGAVEGLELVLRAGGGLSGEVYAPDGRPDAGRQVAVRDFALLTIELARADGSGRFRVEPLAPGLHQVMALPSAAPGAAHEPLMATVEIAAGEQAHVVLGTPLAAGGGPVLLRGRVTRAGAGEAGAQVTALPEGGSLLGSARRARSGPDGGFELELARSGEHLLVVASDQGSAEFRILVPAVREHDVQLSLPEGRIEGRVSGPDGLPVAGASITYQGRQPTSILALGAAAARSDGDGRYVLAGLEPGTYTLRVEARGFTDQGLALGGAVRDGLVVGSTPLVGVDFELGPAGTILGAVWDERGAPVADAAIFVRAESGQLLNPFSRTLTGADGRFEFRGCPAGSFTVRAQKGPAVSQESAPVFVGPGGQALVELALAGGTVLRVVTEDARGRPARAAVRVLDAAGREQGATLDERALERLLSQGLTSGETRVGPLPPGRYAVSATGPDGSGGQRSVELGGEEEHRLVVPLEAPR